MQVRDLVKYYLGTDGKIHKFVQISFCKLAYN